MKLIKFLSIIVVILCVPIIIAINSKEESNDLKSISSTLNVINEWDVNLGEKIVNYAVFEDNIYVMLSDKNLVILNVNGAIESKFIVDSEEALKAYSMNISEKYIVFESGDELVVVDQTNEKVLYEMNLDSHSLGTYIHHDLLFYTDAFKDAVIGWNILEKRMVWEFTNNNETSRAYSVYGIPDRFFIENVNTNEVFEMNLENLNILHTYNNEIIGTAIDGKDQYNVWGIEGITDEEVLEVWRSWISNTIYPLSNGTYYKRRADKISLFSSSFEKTFEYQLPGDSYYSLLWNDLVVVYSDDIPLVIFDPELKDIVWIDEYTAKSSIPEVIGDFLLITYHDGQVRKIRSVD